MSDRPKPFSNNRFQTFISLNRCGNLLNFFRIVFKSVFRYSQDSERQSV